MEPNSASVYDFTVTTASGEQMLLERFRGEVLLVVNVASRCGFTPQYRALQALHAELAPRGFSVLAFPCNQFREQEPGSNEEIRGFCEVEFGVTFPLFSKIDVNGPHADPLFVFLEARCPGILGTRAVKWNFTKFLIDRSGVPVRRFAPLTDPLAIRSRIETLLDSPV